MSQKRKRMAAGILAVCVLLGGYLAWQNRALTVSHISVKTPQLPAQLTGLRVVHLSDLHNAQFGKENVRLLELVEALNPDLIAITGDLVDSRRTDTVVAVNAVERLARLAPVYYVPGNHESRLEGYPSLRTSLEQAGAIALEDRTAVFEKDGAQLTLLGLKDPAFFRDGGGAPQGVQLRLTELMAGEGEYTLLLSHRPELFDVYQSCGVDVTLSGHAHGGQIRIPGLGGVIAPNQGLFPQYTAGSYEKQGSVLVVSRGLGNSLFPFRVNNRPEVVLVELVPQDA